MLMRTVLFWGYNASNGNSLLTFWYNIRVPSSMVKKSKSFLTLEDGTDTLYQDAGKGLPFNDAL
jgi:hypothetical protein